MVMHSPNSSLSFTIPPASQFEHRLDSLEGGMDIDIHTAAQMIETFDVDEFLNGVITPSTPKQGALFQSDSQVLTTASDGMLVLTETIASGSHSEGSDDSASELITSVRVADKTVGGDSSEESKKLQRKSRKEEIVELRESVEELTEQLEALKADPPQGAPVLCQSDGPLTKRSGPSLWKHVAMRQLDKRRKAEEDNVMLREMLEMQVQEAKCLQRILKRRTKIQVRPEAFVLNDGEHARDEAT
ncbi:Hypothetical protein PHPALM_4397 [Phytophthora palmivora]|uniref:Uncharacterized protein n=1 Tax=Phytophthora palmivora TaxID=4796 RepID=A0A2P4YJW8_9STRA|nr:Hypothetical protein PHPALM_4397 [Phytophthora palmivora]